METFIQPATYSTEMTEAVPSRGMSQSDGNFGSILANYLQKGGEKKTASNEKTAENPGSSMMAYFLSAHVGSNLSRFPGGDNISSSNSREDPKQAPSSPPLSGTLNGDQAQPINSDEKYTSLQVPNPQEGKVIPPPSFTPSEVGQQGKGAASTQGEEAIGLEKENTGLSQPQNLSRGKINPVVPPQMATSNTPSEVGQQEKGAASTQGEEAIGLEKENTGLSQPQNLSRGKIDPVVPPQMATSEVMEEGLVPGEMISEKGSSSNPTSKSAKSVISPVDEGIYKEDEEKLSLQKVSSATAAIGSSGPLDPKDLTADGLKFEKAEKKSLLQMDSPSPAAPPNSSLPEETSLLESHTQAPTSFFKNTESSFGEGGEKGQEEVLLMGNKSAQLANRETQNDLDFSGTSPVVMEGSTQMSEKVEEVKEDYSPTPPKSETQAVSQQVSEKIVWLIRNNEESVKITLDPPQLGHIYMEIDRNKENIKTTLWTDNSATKETLETNQSQIQKIIESDGFKLDKFDVFVQQDMGWYQGGKNDPTNSNLRKPASLSEIRTPLSGSPEPVSALTRAAHPASKYLDFFI